MNMYFTSVAATPSRLHNPPGSRTAYPQHQSQQLFAAPSKPRSTNHHPPVTGQATPNSLTTVLGLLTGNTHHHHHHSDAENVNNMVPPINVVLRRHSAEVPWGFRLQGGSDYNLELMISKTQNGSPSEGVLHQGDSILSINGENSRNLSHDEATHKIKSSGTDLQLTISRRQGDCMDLKPRGQLKFSAPHATRA